MRHLACALLLAASGNCVAQYDSLTRCLAKLADDPRLMPIAGKVAVGASSGAAAGSPANTSLPDGREKRAISLWAGLRGECLEAQIRNGKAGYRPPREAMSIAAESEVIAAASDLYDGKITFGEFNRRRQGVAEDLRAKAAALSEQIQQQRAAQERADLQAREREQVAKRVEDLEQEVLTAQQQQYLQAQKAGATRPRAEFAMRRPYFLAAVPQRTCYRFGSRTVCTFR